MEHLGVHELMANLDPVQTSPANRGRITSIVLRPAPEERTLVDEALLDVERGVIGDGWWERMRAITPDDAPASPMRVVAFRRQVALINMHFARLVAGSAERAPLCGDQLHVDWDLSTDNLPVGGRISVGEALLEISPKPHRGCSKFAQRFGDDALDLVRTPLGQQLRLRGVYARVVEGGRIRVGDTLSMVDPPSS